MGLFDFFNRESNATDGNLSDAAYSAIDEIMNVYAVIVKNAEALNCQFVEIGPYWVEYNGVVTFGSGAIAVGIRDFEDRQINVSFAESLGLEITRLQGETFARMLIGNGKQYPKKEKGAIIKRVYENLHELYPGGFPHTYDDKNQTIMVIM